MFVKVLLPLYIQDALLYSVPVDLREELIVGVRVSVSVGERKLYSGIVIEIIENLTPDFRVKEIIDTIDKTPIVGESQLKLWQWIADYYLCTLGEVMKAALPAGMRLESERKISLKPGISGAFPDNLANLDRLILNNLFDGRVSISELAKKINRKNILPNIKKLMELGIIDAEDELTDNYKYKHRDFITLHPALCSEDKLALALSSLKKGSKQEELLEKYLTEAEPLSYNAPLETPKNQFLKQCGISTAVYKACEKKEIFLTLRKTVERINLDFATRRQPPELSAPQQRAFEALKNSDKPALLFGVTSSGKTEIYIRLIDEAFKQNKQVLYLLPEIALTTQMIERLGMIFGSKTGIYHSRFSDAERTETYNKILNLRNSDDKSYLVLGVRSSLFLPFDNLGLIIVDEEHENTYKQFEPTPRYNARDAAVVAGNIYGAKVVLGSATPSMESYYNAITDKYTLVGLGERYGKSPLPEIRTIDMKRAYRKNKVVSHFSETLLEAMRETLQRGEQIILFQNRRGYSPFVQCNDCGFVIRCEHCDVSLTYHKYNNSLSCHYCGYSIPIPTCCPACKLTDIKTKGFGTEKIEDELSVLIPEAKVERLDLDAAKSKFAYEKILCDFDAGETDILVGTQMITKGLDFSNVGLVGIMNADNLLNFPDFRAYERSFQLMSQVAGRSGRKDKQGTVLIQTSTPANPIIRQVINHDFETFFASQLRERQDFNYPPFSRVAIVSLKHSNRDLLYDAGNHLKIILQNIFGNSLAGPEPPPVGRVQNKYIVNFRIKLTKTANAETHKRLLCEILNGVKNIKKFAGIRIITDIDAY